MTANLKVLKNLGPTKHRTVSSLIGLSPRLVYGVFNVNTSNAVKSVVERMLFVRDPTGRLVEPPVPSPFTFSDLNAVYVHFYKIVKPTAPLTKDQFLGTYVGRKRTIYENAYESLRVKPFRKSDSYINWFMKCEKVAFTEAKEPVPRGISPRSPRYHVQLGPYVKRIEKDIYDVIAQLCGGKTVFKGLNAFERGRQMRLMWDQFTDPVAVGLDASRFDQHVSVEALEWEHSIYKLYFPHDRKLKGLLEMQKKNKCYGNLPDCRLEFTVNGKRMSGDMNTSLGNCLLMSSMVYAYVHGLGITKFRLANDGDDCVLIIERKDLRKLSNLKEWFLRKGFSMKQEPPVDVFEQIEFCQSNPIWTEDGYVMVRNPLTSLSKDCISTMPLRTEKLARRWMAAVGEGGLALTGQIPVVQEFYSKLLNLGNRDNPFKMDQSNMTGAQYLAKGMKRKYGVVHWMTRVSFWRAFGLTPDRQIALEQEYKRRGFETSPDHANTIGVRDFPL